MDITAASPYNIYIVSKCRNVRNFKNSKLRIPIMNHRYRLAHYRECRAHREWNTTCPACGHRGKFVPYIDTHTMRPVDDRQCGRCNRESNCGYHLPPRQLPRTEEYVSRKAREERESPGPVKQKDNICVRQNNQQERHYEKMHRACEQSQPWGSHLVTWLRTRFPREAVAAAIKRYRVGGTPDGATLWWQIDSQGRVRTGKAMRYNPLTGHRVKESGGAVNWAHRMRLYGEPSELVVEQCLFGEHLASLRDGVMLSTANLQVAGPKGKSKHLATAPAEESFVALGMTHPAPSLALVESEKTALIMSLVKPGTLWLATGGKQNFKDAMLAPLLDHEVAVYPDADALADWSRRIGRLNTTLGHRLYIPVWYYNLMDHEQPRREGWDLADVMMET